MLAPVVSLVHHAHFELLMVAAMDAEDEVTIDGLGVGCQVLLPALSSSMLISMAQANPIL